MDFSIGNLVRGVVGAVAKVATAVVNVITGAVSAMASAIGSVVSNLAEAVLGVEATVANACEDLEEEAEELLEDTFKLLVGAFIATFGSGSSGTESQGDEDTNNLPEYDPLTARLKEKKGTRVKKKGANDQYFAGKIDEFGNFIPDDSNAYSDDGYEAYKKSMYDYAKTQKTIDGDYATDWQIDAYNVQNAPWKYKSKALGDYFNDKYPISDYFAQMYTQSAINQGLDPESSEMWGKIYGDFSAGMALETGVTQSVVGFKSLTRGFSYERDVIVGSGAGNLKKGVTQADERLTSLTKEQLKGKPKNSPNPDKWFKKNGTISIDDEGVWTYHDWEGKSVSYPDGYPDFKSAGMVEQEVNIGPFQGYNKDFPRGDELAPNGPISESSTWHHHQDGVTLQEVLTKLHERFRHRGGMSKIKK